MPTRHMPSIAENDAYGHYKRIRNQIRKFDSASLIDHAIRRLHVVFHKGIDEMRLSPPWQTLLLIKWVIEEASNPAAGIREAKTNDFIKLSNMMLDMADHMRLPSSFVHPTFFMRQIAFQQFPLQHTINKYALARQEMLFSGLEANHSFQTEFSKATGGLRYNDFNEISFATISLLLTEPKRVGITKHDFRLIKPRLQPGAIDIFFNFLSKTFDELKHALKPKHGTRNLEDEWLLPSPLYERPLLNDGGVYIIYHPPMLYRTLESIVYRTLKRDSADILHQRFGKIFERHVARCLSEAGVPYIDEDQLKTILPVGKYIDFTAVEGEHNILIDAKGVEMSELGRIAADPGLVFRAIRKSAGDAIVQGMETAIRIRNLTTSDRTRFGTGRCYLIVVTYDSLHLGASSTYKTLFGEDFITKLNKQFGTDWPFGLEDIFFIPSETFERLCAHIRAGDTTLLAALRFAADSDKQLSTQRFSFALHLAELCRKTRELPVMEEALTRMLDRCMSRFPIEAKA